MALKKEKIKNSMFFWAGILLLSILNIVFCLLNRNVLLYNLYIAVISVVVLVFWIIMYMRRK